MFAPRQQGTVIAKGLKIVGSVTAEIIVEGKSQIEGEHHCTSIVNARGPHINERGASFSTAGQIGSVVSKHIRKLHL